MTTRHTLKRVGGTTIVLAALAVVPLTANAMVTKYDVDQPAVNATATARAVGQAEPASNTQILVPRVGYVDVTSPRGKLRAGTRSDTHGGGPVVLVPKVGYVNGKTAS